MYASWFGWYAFCCCFFVGVDEVLVFVIGSKCLRYLLKSIKFVLQIYRIFIAYFSIVGWGLVIECGFLAVCVIFLRRFRSIFVMTILWSENTPSKEEYASQFRVLLIRFSLTLLLVFCQGIHFLQRNTFSAREYIFCKGIHFLQGNTVHNLPRLRTSNVDRSNKRKWICTKKNTRSRRYPAETITDADYADDLALLAPT